MSVDMTGLPVRHWWNMVIECFHAIAILTIFAFLRMTERSHALRRVNAKADRTGKPVAIAMRTQRRHRLRFNQVGNHILENAM
jgi:hypothetical protein